MSKSAELAQLIRDRAGSDAPEYGLILGSGLGHLSAQIDGVALSSSEEAVRESVRRNFWYPRYRRYRRAAF